MNEKPLASGEPRAVSWLCRLPFLLAACCSLLASPLLAVPPSLPPFPPLEFHPPKPERLVLGNGLVIFLLEDHELPLIRLSASFQAGSQYDPPEKVGRSGLFGNVLTEGGSLSHSPEDIESVLDKTASSIGFSVDLEHGSGALSCRAADFDTVFGIFTDLLLYPQFRKDRLELTKAKTLESLRRLNDDPEEVARREFRKLAYGSQHPYARIPTPATIDAIERKDLSDMHQRFFRPNAAWIAVSGDFQSAEMKSKLQKAFDAWPRSEMTMPVVPPMKAEPQDQRVYYIQRAINQSQIRIGHFGLERHNPDHFAWEVFNELWGGSASSVLFRTVRTQLGLAYSVASAFSEPAEKGLIVTICQTRGPQTIAAAQAILKINQDVKRAPFRTEEIHWAKESIRNRFIENYTSSAQIAADIMNSEALGFPANYMDTYTAHIAQVSEQDLRRVAKKYLHPDLSAILIMGDLSTFDKPISTLGKPQEIKLIDYTNDQP